jgi:hypothetical protein
VLKYPCVYLRCIQSLKKKNWISFSIRLLPDLPKLFKRNKRSEYFEKYTQKNELRRKLEYYELKIIYLPDFEQSIRALTNKIQKHCTYKLYAVCSARAYNFCYYYISLVLYKINVIKYIHYLDLNISQVFNHFLCYLWKFKIKCFQNFSFNYSETKWNVYNYISIYFARAFLRNVNIFLSFVYDSQSYLILLLLLIYKCFTSLSSK